MVESVAAICSSGNEVDGGGRRVAGAEVVAEVAGVTAAGDEQDAGLGAPAVLCAGADRLVEVAERPSPASEARLASSPR